MKPRAFLLVVSIVLLTLSLRAGEQTAEQQLKDFLTLKSERGDVFAQGTLDGVDYRKLLHGAIAKDDKSLSAIFQYTAHGKLMGEGADDNCMILHQLLIFWGDRDFARVLAGESRKVRFAVIDAIDYDYPRWKANYPLTYRLGKPVGTKINSAFIQGDIRIVPPVKQEHDNTGYVVTAFNDGGTKAIDITDGEHKTFHVFFDHRIGTKTPGAIYLNAYPGEAKSVRVLNQEEFMQKIGVYLHEVH